MGIVIVFFIGLVKLWVSNRHMRRLEELDAEKQMRITQTKKSGVSSSTSKYHRLGNEIPFGVKALENNVEVEGVWVARMASMASRPPERKWSSMRKARSSSAANALHASNGSSSGGSGFNKKAQRGSKRGSSKISRSEILVPSSRTRNKLENLSLLEEEEELQEPSRDAVPNHVGTLGKLQRGLKKMTSTETGGQSGERKRASSSSTANQAAAFGAKEFQEGTQARTPQRFYPPSTSTTDSTAAMPLVGESKRQHGGRQPRTLVKKKSAMRHQQSRSSSRESRFSSTRAPSTDRNSVDKSSRERPRAGPPSIPTRVSSESARTSASARSVAGGRGDHGAYRQSRRKSSDSQRQQQQDMASPIASSDGSGHWRRSLDGREQQQDMAPQAISRSMGSTHRYPPNSSRSGGANPLRSRSFN